MTSRRAVTRTELIASIRAASDLSAAEADAALQAFLDTIVDALERGEDVTFADFGRFDVARRSAREGRNPSTGERLAIPSSRVPRFTPGPRLKRAVKGGRVVQKRGDPDTDY